MNWVRRTVQSLRILDFDSECRPMHYSEFRDESQITALAWGWVDETKVHDVILNQDLSNERDMLGEFLEAYQAADMVTGHYLLKHDLPLLNDHCMRFGWSLLERKLVQDTKMALPRVKGLGLSQDNLATLYKLDAKKHHMNGVRWAGANTLSEEGREEARVRVTWDVKQHKKIRARLLELGYLGAPKRWVP